MLCHFVFLECRFRKTIVTWIVSLTQTMTATKSWCPISDRVCSRERSKRSTIFERNSESIPQLSHSLPLSALLFPVSGQNNQSSPFSGCVYWVPHIWGDKMGSFPMNTDSNKLIIPIYLTRSIANKVKPWGVLLREYRDGITCVLPYFGA